MSYILDALRRADAERERERGAVPGLHTVPAGAPVAVAAPRPAVWLAVALVGALLALLALLVGWWQWQQSPPAQAVVPPPRVAALPASPTPAPPTPEAPVPARPAAVPALTPTARPGTPAPARAEPPALSSLQPQPKSQSQSESESQSQSPPPVVATPALPRPVAAPSARMSASQPASPLASAPPGPPARGAAPAPAEDPVPAFEQLPDDVKRSLPPLAIGGAIYSDNPGSRMLMIGGQLLREGDSAGGGVTLEQIRPRSAVLRWKDVRYEVRF